MKYKPGIRTQYMSRWCQITKTHFLYYAESLPFASFLGRPLAVIPIEDLVSIKRVFVDVPEKTEEYQALKNFQFEIFIKNFDSDGEEEFDDQTIHAKSEKQYESPLKKKDF